MTVPPAFVSLPTTDAVSLVIGPDHHGVVRHAMSVADAAGTAVVRSVHVPATAEVAALGAGAAVVHLHYTDRLFGPDATTAAAHLIDLASRLDRRVVISLHDVPELDGSAHSTLRVTAYRVVARRADAVIVASEHERRRLRRCGIDVDVQVIPLPIATRSAAALRSPSRRTGGRTVGVLGFIYPGKGHADVIEACADLPTDVAVVALGEASEGHLDMVAQLVELARRYGRRLDVTGHLDDLCLAAALNHVDVPVVPARTMSASASLFTWLGAGRRPVVAANDYTREVAADAPGLMTLYDPHRPGRLAAAVGAALTDPCSTWHRGAIPAAYSHDAVGRSHRCLYRRVVQRA